MKKINLETMSKILKTYSEYEPSDPFYMNGSIRLVKETEFGLPEDRIFVGENPTMTTDNVVKYRKCWEGYFPTKKVVIDGLTVYLDHHNTDWEIVDLDDPLEDWYYLMAYEPSTKEFSFFPCWAELDSSYCDGSLRYCTDEYQDIEERLLCG